MFYFVFKIFFILFQFSITDKIQAENINSQILFTGKFHGNEITATSGEIWYGLFQTKNGTELRQCQITVKPIRDESNGDRPNQKTGKQVTINQPHHPLLLVKGIPNLQAGPIVTVYNNKEFLHPNQPVTFASPFQIYQLKASGNAIDLGGITKIENYIITLSTDSITQIIAQYKQTFPGMGEPNPVWAGDIDADQKPDLLMDLHNSHTGSEYVLFLSSFAKTNQLVGKATTFIRITD